MATRADRPDLAETRADRRQFPGISQPGRTTLKGVSISTDVSACTTVRELATCTQQALDELVNAVSRRLNEISVYVDQTGEQKRDAG